MVCIGKIKKTKGNKGEVLIETSPFFFALLRGNPASRPSYLTLRHREKRKVFQLESLGFDRGRLVAKLKGIESIDEAYRLRGYRAAFEDRDLGIPLAKSLRGFAVMDRNRQCWGKVVRILRGSLNPLMVVRKEEREVLIPFQTPIIDEVDEDAGEVRIDPPKGLRNLNP